MRKLATIRKIKQILPIEGADKIELALVDGWQVVVKKGEFQKGELCCYLEIDSWVPNTIAPFLTKEGKEPKEFNGIKGERLKTVKLRGQLSQGLILPVSVVNDKANDFVKEGDDVTELLGVQKWEIPETPMNTSGNKQPSQSRPFPYFIRKTDQERVQNMGMLVGQCLDEVFEATIKKDGSSLTVFRVDPSSQYYSAAKKLIRGKMNFVQRTVASVKDLFIKKPVHGVCSRNLLLAPNGDSNFHKAAKKYDLFNTLDALAECRVENFKSLAIQGELLAPDIQGNFEKVKDVEFHCFDIWNIDRQNYVEGSTRRAVCFAGEIPHVTVLKVAQLKDIVECANPENIVQKCLDYAEGKGDNIPFREGTVFKSETRDFSFKAISNSYLLKTGK